MFIVSQPTEGRGREKHSRRTLPSSLESKGKGEEIAFRFARFCFYNLTVMKKSVLRVLVSCLDYLEGMMVTQIR